MATKKSSQVRIKLLKSPIGRNKRQRKTLEALGLKRVGQIVERKDSESLQGMLTLVSHLIQVEDVN
ncbi:MAG: 50S ribosomal protein L30 [Chloroflexi bacterium]|nr:50S ribosomal protein L30 [Chloroflexota bacterium]